MTARFILAISTSSGVAKVAAAAESLSQGDGSSELFSFEIIDYKSQSALLLPMTSQHLERAGLTPSLCAAVAVDIGPGGFTSLRTACGIAQGLAVAWKVPTVPLTSFECMMPANKADKPLTVLMDARLNEIYAACIQRTGQGTEWIKQPHLLAWQICSTSPAQPFVMGNCLRSFTAQRLAYSKAQSVPCSWQPWHGRNSWRAEWPRPLIANPCMFVTRLLKPPLNDWR
jgi:tRNA threonylcarbamoyl adenosine modification protein YeaZ